MKRPLVSIPEIEDAMADVVMHPKYLDCITEYNRMLSVMGNVDGNEIVALCILAWLRSINDQDSSEVL